MLVLTRKPGQSIMIGDGVEVQVLSVAGEKVRLGITAPRDEGFNYPELSSVAGLPSPNKAQGAN